MVLPTQRLEGGVAIDKVVARAMTLDGNVMAPNDTFILYGLHDFGSAATAVATKICDSAPCAGEVISAKFTLVEAKAGGSVDDQTVISKNADGSNPATGTLTLDMSDAVYMNAPGSVAGLMGLGTANAKFAKGGDIYAYTGAAADRSAGQYFVEILCKKL
jgi:hypothetical protein